METTTNAREITAMFGRLLNDGWAAENEATIDDIWVHIASRILSRRDVELYHEGARSRQFRSFVAALSHYAPDFEIQIWGIPNATGGEEPVTYIIHTNVPGANLPVEVSA